MKRYALKFYLVCNDSSFRTTIKNKINAKTDPAVWPIQYNGGNTYEDDDGNTVLEGYVVFNAEADLTVLKNKFTAITSTLDTKCLPGSYVDRVETEHYQDGEHIHSDKPCVATRLWSK